MSLSLHHVATMGLEQDCGHLQGAQVQEGPLVMPEEKKLHLPTKYAVVSQQIIMITQKSWDLAECTKNNQGRYGIHLAAIAELSIF